MAPIVASAEVPTAADELQHFGSERLNADLP